MQRCRDRIVGRLSAVHVVVRVHRVVVAQRTLPEDFVGAVRQHFIHVHVRRSARTRLEHFHHELVIELPGEHLVGGLHDGVGALFGNEAEVFVGQCRRTLHDGVGVDEGLRHEDAADREVVDSALRVDPVVGVGGYLVLANGVVFGACGR